MLIKVISFPLILIVYYQKLAVKCKDKTKKLSFGQLKELTVGNVAFVTLYKRIEIKANKLRAIKAIQLNRKKKVYSDMKGFNLNNEAL